MTTAIERFKRHVNAAAGIYYRQDAGTLTGRNSTSTDLALRRHVRDAQAMLRERLDDDPDGLFDYLDSHPRFAAKWDRVERRFVGLPN